MVKFFRAALGLLVFFYSGWTFASALNCTSGSASAATAISKASFNLLKAVLPSAAAAPSYFISPLSIVYAVALAENGAGNKSATQTEILRLLSASQSPLSEKFVNAELQRVMYHLNGLCGSADSTQVVMANSIWTAPNATIKPAYVASTRDLFNATARVATNGSRDINAWAEQLTHGLIKDLIKSDSFYAILANAVYFKARWAQVFQKEATVEGPFTTPSGTKFVDFMRQTYSNLSCASKAGWYDAVFLPYEGGKYSAIALLPAEGKTVADVVKEWAARPKAPKATGPVALSLPRFNASTDTQLKAVLQGLGVKQMFDPARANFSRLTDAPIYASDVVHKVFITVGENGTEAAAGTAVIMPTAALVNHITFDRPFAFIVQHNPTKLPLFAGVVNEPSGARATPIAGGMGRRQRALRRVLRG